MKITLWPKTTLGKWAAALNVAFIILLWLKMKFSLPIMSFAIVGLGLLGFAFAVITVIKNKEKSVLVLLSVF